MEDLINALAKGAIAAIMLYPITLFIQRRNAKEKKKEEEALERLIQEQQKQKEENKIQEDQHSL